VGICEIVDHVSVDGLYASTGWGRLGLPPPIAYTIPFTVAAPNEKRAVGIDVFDDQPLMTTSVLGPPRDAVPSYRVPVQFATIDPVAPFDGMHVSVRFTS
jgi:hypothetical protein